MPVSNNEKTPVFWNEQGRPWRLQLLNPDPDRADPRIVFSNSGGPGDRPEGKFTATILLSALAAGHEGAISWGMSLLHDERTICTYTPVGADRNLVTKEYGKWLHDMGYAPSWMVDGSVMKQVYRWLQSLGHCLEVSP